MPHASRTRRAFMYIALIAMAGFFLLPVYVLLTTSFKSMDTITLNTMWSLPSKIDFSGYEIAFSRLSPSLWNSLLMAVPATVLASLFGSMNGYVFAKWRFKGSETIFTLLLFGMFIPYQSIMIPLIQFMQEIKLYNTIPGLILVHVIYGLPITTLIFRNFYASIPNEIMESSKIDGAGFFGIYRYIILPLSVTGFVVVGIWEFTNIWNEFLFAVTLTTQSKQPIMVALQNLSGSQIVQWNAQMAGAVLAALPTLIVYILLGRYFIRGMLAGSVKG